VKTKKAIKAASTCRGSISIIHEDNEVTVLNPNDPDKEEPRLLGRKRIKKHNKSQNKTKKKQHRNIKERWRNHHLLAKANQGGTRR
jgi:hypothetical protein